MEAGVEALERPLPKPGRDRLGYAAARTLEALLEAILALEFLERGYTRNAAGKAFQAWRALTAAILALEYDRIAERLGSEEEKKWLEDKALPRVPTTRLSRLARLVEDAGYPGYFAYTSVALDLHDYQYHGPDPDAELSKYASRSEAADAVTYLVKRIVEIVDGRVKPLLVERGAWSGLHGEALGRLRRMLQS